MASGFSPGGKNQCNGRRCTAKEDAPVAEYLVNEAQLLCKGCAETKSSVGSVAPMIDGTRNVLLYCPKHEGKPAENYCETHGVLVCRPCAIASHQKPCDLKVTEDALEHKLELLKGLYKDGLRMLEDMRRIDAEVNKKKSTIGNRLQTMELEIKTMSEETGKKIADRQRERDAKARMDADEKVKRIYMERDRLLQQSNQVAKKEEERNQQEMKKLLEELRGTFDDIGFPSVVQEVSSEMRKFFNDANKATVKAEGLLCDARRLLIDGKGVEESLRGIVDTEVNTSRLEEVMVRSEAIELRKDETSTSGTIGITRKVWRLTSTVDLPKKIKIPRIGFLTKDMVLVLDVKSKVLEAINIAQKTTKLLMSHTAAFTVDNRTLVTVNVDPGRLREYKFFYIEGPFIWDEGFDTKLRSLMIGYNPEKNGAKIDVGGGRMFLVSSDNPRDIYDITGERRVFSSFDSECLPRSIVIKVKAIHDFAVLDNGDIVVKTNKNRFITVDSNGVKKNEIQRPYWDKADVALDKSTNTLYIVYLNEQEKRVSVEVTDASGLKKNERVLIDPNLIDVNQATHCAVFKSQRLCLCNGNKLHIFE